MELAWNWAALPGLVGGALAAALAALVYAAAPARAQNRWLAGMLAVDAVGAATAFGLLYLATDPATAWAFQQVGTAAFLWSPPLYLGFLGTLDAPGVRWLRARGVVVALLAAGAAASVHRALVPAAYIARVEPVFYAPYEAVQGPAGMVANFAFASAATLGLLVALAAWRRASGPVARRRAGLYAAAFGVRDAMLLVMGIFSIARGTTVIATGSEYAVLILLPQLVQIVFVAILGHAILSAQLFEIDVRLRWTLSRGTVAAAFVAVFFVVTQVAEQTLSARYGALLGGVAAGLLLFALAPLQRAAERVAAVAVPAPAVPAALGERLALYRDHVRAAWEDGVLDRSERRMLEHLRSRLGLAAEEALRVEDEVAAA